MDGQDAQQLAGKQEPGKYYELWRDYLDRPKSSIAQQRRIMEASGQTGGGRPALRIGRQRLKWIRYWGGAKEYEYPGWKNGRNYRREVLEPEWTAKSVAGMENPTATPSSRFPMARIRMASQSPAAQHWDAWEDAARPIWPEADAAGLKRSAGAQQPQLAAECATGVDAQPEGDPNLH